MATERNKAPTRKHDSWVAPTHTNISLTSKEQSCELEFSKSGTKVPILTANTETDVEVYFILLMPLKSGVGIVSKVFFYVFFYK